MDNISTYTVKHFLDNIQETLAHTDSGCIHLTDIHVIVHCKNDQGSMQRYEFHEYLNGSSEEPFE